MTEEPAPRVSQAPLDAHSPTPTPGSGPDRPESPADDTAPRRDPREVVGIYLSDSLANIGAVRRVLGRAALLSPHLEIELKTARSALQAARQILAEEIDHA